MSASDFGALCELDDLDPATTTREGYLAVASERLLYGDGVRWQLDALVGGFREVLPLQLLRGVQLSPSNLAVAICGRAEDGGGADADFTIGDVFRIACVDDEFAGSEPLTTALWRVVEAWPPAEKRAFVKFVTGSDRLPPARTEVLSLQAAYTGVRGGPKAELGVLPQAHTCDNVLELPNYWEALCQLRGAPASVRGAAAESIVAELETILQSRLQVAVRECDAYGLDEGGRAAPQRLGPPYDAAGSGPGSSPPCYAPACTAHGDSRLDAFVGAPPTGPAAASCGAAAAGGGGAVGRRAAGVALTTIRAADDDDADGSGVDEIESLQIESLLAETSHVVASRRPPPEPSPPQRAPPLADGAARRPHASGGAPSRPRDAAHAEEGSMYASRTEGAEEEEEDVDVDDLITALDMGALHDEERAGEAPAHSVPHAAAARQPTLTRPAAPLERGMSEHSKVTSGDIDIDLENEIESLLLE